MTQPQLRVTGIRELRNALSKVDAETPKRLREGLRAIASKVATRAASGVPKISGKAAGSIKPRATTTGAGIAFGGSAAPYYPWLDFGGRVRRASRPFIKEGRYIYPTISDMNSEIKQDVDDLLESVIKSADFDTKGVCDVWQGKSLSR